MHIHTLKKNFGHTTSKVFAYPYGSHSDVSVNTLKSLGFVQNLVNGKCNTSNTLDLSRLDRICIQQNYNVDTILKLILLQQDS